MLWSVSSERSLCDDDDVYLDKSQTKGVRKSILYMWNADYSQ
jgi:hypothetical protein